MASAPPHVDAAHQAPVPMGEVGVALSGLGKPAAAGAADSPGGAAGAAAKGDVSHAASRNQDLNPELRAGFFSRLTFSYLDPLFRLGQQRPLQHDDLPPIMFGDRAASSLQRTAPVAQPKNLREVLWAGFKREFLLTGLFKFTNSTVQFLPPLILNELLKRLEDGEGSYTLAIAFFVVYVLRALVENQYFIRSQRVAFRVRGALTTLVYDKALRLSPWARQQSTIGEQVNLMQLDTERIERSVGSLHSLWDGLYQITGYSVMLAHFVGASFLAGIAVMICIVPFLAKVAMAMGRVRSRLVKRTDARVKLENEVLQNMQAVKLYHWEDSFHGMAADIRAGEVRLLRGLALLKAAHSAAMMSAPAMVGVATLLTFSATGGDMRPSTVFTALSLMEGLRFPLLIYPMVLSGLVEARVAERRLCRFLGLADSEAPDSSGAPGSLCVAGATFHWAPDTEPVLSDVSLDVAPGTLVGVVGRVGTGKSALIASLLGDCFRSRGELSVAGRIAYVSQTPWVLNDTLRNNVLFGAPLDERRYREAVRACALQQDIDMLPDGHDTMIGERGITLSGGQKQRVALARAMYCDADIYILDDPLSALDAEVGRHVFTECVLKALKGKTRLLVTNHVGLLADADRVLHIADGGIAHQGTYDEVKEHLDHVGGAAEGAEGESPEEESPEEVREASEAGAEPSEAEEAKQSSTGAGATAGASTAADQQPMKKPAGKLMQDEERRTGAVSLDVYLAYVRTGSARIFGFIVVVALMAQFAVVAQSAWLAEWSDDASTNDLSNSEQNTYMGVYAALGIGIAVFAYFRSLSFAELGVRASTRLHDGLFERVLHAPMSFFDTTPIGRIISRFSKDLDQLDTLIPHQMNMLFVVALLCFGTVAVLVSAVPPILILLVPLTVIYVRVMNYFRAVARELKRLDSIARSPVYANFSQTLGGLPVIRAFGHAKRFLLKHEAHVDRNIAAYYHLKVADRWLSVRLEFIGAAVLSLTAVMVNAAMMEDGEDGESDWSWLAGLSLSPAIAGWVVGSAQGLSSFLGWTVRFFAETESLMNSVERISHTTRETEQEAPWKRLKADEAAGAAWPAEGAIAFTNVVARYRPTTPRVLHGVSFATRPGEKIGVAGRTGSGKSTVLLTLFRLLELEKGSITIDGVDIATLGLARLRSSLAIIPQLPVLFSGTVRSNLDPFGKYTDAQLWDALEKVQLKGVVESLSVAEGASGVASGLDAEVAESGENFSAGQRQLVCLCRVILRNSKILVLDEATSSVDHHTDALVQTTIREQFGACTILTIAHRVNTIIDSDRILVLDDGRVAEFAPPGELLADPTSKFAGLVAEMGGAGPGQ